MGYNYSNTLNPAKALIWRIVHRDNVRWILQHGLHAGNSPLQAPGWVPIGNPELTGKRASHHVPIAPGGVLNDYVPFYFTPFSPMLKNIHSGWAGITQRPNEEIVILVSSLHRLQQLAVPFVFTDSHAYYQWAGFYDALADLPRIDWPLLQQRDFKRDPDDPSRFERYQAEALVHRHCPVDALLGMVCYTEEIRQQLETDITQTGSTIKVHVRPGWYFT